MNYKDVTVAKTSELADGEMKQLSANGAEILLACVGGKFHAALDDLARYELRVENDQVIVRVPDEATDRSVPAMTTRDTTDERLFVIAGGGAAGYAAAQTLREDGFAGRVDSGLRI